MATEKHKNWFDLIRDAQKTAVISDGKRKVHYLLENGKQMVEEYHNETNVLLRRAWKEKNDLGKELGWEVEIGDPEPKEDNFDVCGIRENPNNPFITRRVTKTLLEWRIHNLDNSKYPIEVFSVVAEDGKIVVRTSNKKYFTKIPVPDLERAGLSLEQSRLEFSKRYNTLIISYKKSAQLLDFEQKIFNEILQVKVKDFGPSSDILQILKQLQ